MFSARTRWDRTVNRLSTLVSAKRTQGARVFDLTETNPTRVGLPRPADLLGPLSDPAGLSYEPNPQGLKAAREAVCADWARRGVAVAPERVFLTASTSEAYAFVFKLLCDPGDDVLVPRPSYPLFEYIAGLESVAVRPYPLVYLDGWHIERDALERTIGARTRAVVVVSPNNPTGSFLKTDEAVWLQELAAARGLAIVSDEVFADYPGGEDHDRAPSLAADGPALAFALGGLSKSCGLPQLKLAWLAVSGPRRLREEALGRLDVIADTYLSVSTPVQLLAPTLLARAPELRAPIAARVAANRRALQNRLERGAPASLLRSEGGWSAVLRIPATMPEEHRVIALLAEHDVLAHPGYFFDFPHEAHLVLSLLPAEEDFAEGVDRIVRVL
jgi:aspartate/methionine/tyrosine aminotransferase